MPRWCMWFFTVIAGFIIGSAISFWQHPESYSTYRISLVTLIITVLYALMAFLSVDAGRSPLDDLQLGTHQIAAFLRREEDAIWFVVAHTQDGRFTYHREYEMSLSGFYGDALFGTGKLIVTRAAGGKMYLFVRDTGMGYEV